MSEMKDSGIEWIGKIPNDWKVYKVKNVCKIRGEKNKPQAQVLSVYRELGVVVKAERNDNYNITSEDTSSYKYVLPNDLVVNKMKAWQGSMGISRFEGIVSPAYYVFKITSDEIYPMFIHYLLRNASYLPEYRRLSGGIRPGQWDLSIENFRDIPILIPQYNCQKRITCYLERKCTQIDSIIAKQQEVIKKLKEYKLSVITEAVTKGLNPDVPMKDSGIEWIGEIPEHWENRKMISILSMRVVDGPHESPDLFDNGIPYISATAIENGKINFDLMRGYISEEYCDICDLRYKPQLHDILVIKLGASTGQVAIVETTDRFNIWVPLAAVRCNEKADPYFIYYAFQSDYFLKQMEMSWTYGTQQTLGVKSIERLRVMLPTLKEQTEIVSYLKSKCNLIDIAVTNKESLISKLLDYKRSLIYEVVTGKKEV
ncbi:hypothetical protein B5G26_09410 [Anaerotignum lactatifermentans]|uniref:Type I restriction modification DNA specificity domain-containing protein n=1 Tax=Anaerotignum lactatifermentans TaxID=160404 RepID=A0A1Y3U0E0_9FIRM|nr:restriction endonuclease subunit S [Anaerotignum lactatifermentans]OUN42181.1 hypothetical protein B5G26_09410 [Anaerotignum lactatifermentans]